MQALHCGKIWMLPKGNQQVSYRHNLDLLQVKSCCRYTYVLAGHSNHANLTPCRLRSPPTLDLAAVAFLVSGLDHACPSFISLQKGYFIRRCD